MLCTGSETLTSKTRIVESAKEDDVVLPQRHSNYNLFEKGGYENEGKGDRTCVLSAPTGGLWYQSDPMSVSRYQNTRSHGNGGMYSDIGTRIHPLNFNNRTWPKK